MSTKTFEQFQQQLEESWDDATSMSSTFPLFKPATTSNTIIPPQPLDDPSTGKTNTFGRGSKSEIGNA